MPPGKISSKQNNRCLASTDVQIFPHYWRPLVTQLHCQQFTINNISFNDILYIKCFHLTSNTNF